MEYLNEILLGIELLAALVALFYFFRLKNSYWKWFCVYLIFIGIQEFFWFSRRSFLGIENANYYAFVGIPVQYLFFFWLFALKSLKNKKLFISFSLIYIASYLPMDYYENIYAVYSLNLTIGTLLLSILVVLEFLKQIRTDDILNFKKNKMFYITAGVILFYIGTYPFFAFYDMFYYDYRKIWDGYHLYFKISNCIMYLLFIASFLWGKQD